MSEIHRAQCCRNRNAKSLAHASKNLIIYTLKNFRQCVTEKVRTFKSIELYSNLEKFSDFCRQVYRKEEKKIRLVYPILSFCTWITFVLRDTK